MEGEGESLSMGQEAMESTRSSELERADGGGSDGFCRRPGCTAGFSKCRALAGRGYGNELNRGI